MAELYEGQAPSDRPNIVTRVFMLKMKHLLVELTSKNVIGKILTHVYVVEIQKRGLPHMHILAPEDKPRNSDDYDMFVSAEIPDKDRLPELYTTATSHQMLGPCGLLDRRYPCMQYTQSSS